MFISWMAQLDEGSGDRRWTMKSQSRETGFRNGNRQDAWKSSAHSLCRHFP